MSNILGTPLGSAALQGGVYLQAAMVPAMPAHIFPIQMMPLPSVLPPVDYSCYLEPVVTPGVTRYLHIRHPDQIREVNLVDGDVRTYVRENNHHVFLNKTVITQVNRNHLHTQRVITNENNYNTYVTNYVTRVKDIHRQRVEHVPGKRRVFNSYKQINHKPEPAKCCIGA